MPNDSGPSWLTFIGHMKDSLWSIGLFRCESIFAQHPLGTRGHGPINATHYRLECACWRCGRNYLVPHVKYRHLNHGAPKYISSDNDPLFRFYRWQANLRILDVKVIKSVPYVPLSHPFVERLIGTIRREYPDHALFWNAGDLKRKLEDYRHYYNAHRVHTSPGRNQRRIHHSPR